MSGHSKWSTIKHKKAKVDAQRGKLFSKVVKEIIVAARQGGGDPNLNLSLKNALQKAKENNVPADNIKRAIQRGTGELEGVTYEEMVYEGYGPQGVALLVDILTDNKNRTAAEIRHIFSKNGGNLGESGCVAWMFDQKGFFEVNKSTIEEDKLMDIALEAGADDMQVKDDTYEIYSTPEDFSEVKKNLEEKGIKIQIAEVTKLPQTYISLGEKDAEKMLKLMEALEDHDDVQNVYANFDIDDEIIEAISNK